MAIIRSETEAVVLRHNQIIGMKKEEVERKAREGIEDEQEELGGVDGDGDERDDNANGNANNNVSGATGADVDAIENDSTEAEEGEIEDGEEADGDGNLPGSSNNVIEFGETDDRDASGPVREVIVPSLNNGDGDGSGGALDQPGMPTNNKRGYANTEDHATENSDKKRRKV